MRAPFNIEVDLYHGRGTPSPCTLRVANVPARIVPDVAFVDAPNPLLVSVSYMTLDLVPPVGPSWVEAAPGVWAVDINKGDLVAVPAGGDLLYSVARVETRSWPTGSPYWRAHLIPALLCTGDCPCFSYSVPELGLLLIRDTPTHWTGPDCELTHSGSDWTLVTWPDGHQWAAPTGWDGCAGEFFVNMGPWDPVTVLCAD